MTSIRIIPFALAILWGFNWPAVKTGLAEVPPFALRMVGLGIGAALLAGLAVLLGRSMRIERRSWWPLVVAGTFNIAVFNLATVFAQINTSTSRAAILTFTTPLWSIVFAWFFLGERLDRAKAMALGIGIGGIAVLAMPLATGEITVLGILFPMVAAVSWAAGSVYQKSHPIEGDRMVATAYQLLIASVVAGVGFVLAGETLPTSLSAKAAIAISFHIVGATAIAYLLWFILLDRLSVGAAALTTFAIPVVGVLGAMALVGDRPTPLDYVGFSAVMLAAAVAMFGAREKPVPAT